MRSGRERKKRRKAKLQMYGSGTMEMLNGLMKKTYGAVSVGPSRVWYKLKGITWPVSKNAKRKLKRYGEATETRV
jgi:hypothetical protein